MKIMENNKIDLVGIASGLEFSHETHGEKFYETKVQVKRNSDYIDVLPVVVSERLIDTANDFNNTRVNVIGELHSKNADGKLILFIFAKEFISNVEGADKNEIELDGFLCKTPTYRETPLGREISDILLAVNRSYGRSDYIPCVVWGRSARYVSKLNVSDTIKVKGRFQSREYTKGEEVRIAYEVSVASVTDSDI